MTARQWKLFHKLQLIIAERDHALLTFFSFSFFSLSSFFSSAVSSVAAAASVYKWREQKSSKYVSDDRLAKFGKEWDVPVSLGASSVEAAATGSAAAAVSVSTGAATAADSASGSVEVAASTGAVVSAVAAGVSSVCECERSYELVSTSDRIPC